MVAIVDSCCCLKISVLSFCEVPVRYRNKRRNKKIECRANSAILKHFIFVRVHDHHLPEGNK